MAHDHAQNQAKPGKRTMVTRVATAVSIAAIAGTAMLGTAESASASTSRAELRSAIVKATNHARAAKGCKPLKSSKRLTKAAQGHASDMAAKNYFSHTSINGRQWWQRIERAGWSEPGGENIAYGFSTTKGVVKAWMNSPGHRRNILDCSFKYIGVGFNGDGDYWVQDFGY